MASLGAACRLSARVAGRQLRNNVASRGFRSSAAVSAAQNFQMPALSPTMTEGNIAKWAVKEGDSFSAGDVLLEIETDKAQMDVEAQDDGIMAKITQGDGTKAIKVGERIAVIAEPGDDLSTLEIPAEESAPQKKEQSPSEDKAVKSSEPAPSKSSGSSEAAKSSSGTVPGKAQKQTYPLYPSILYALRENGLSKEDADKIPATGPNGRLLKGDVLAYAGKLSEKSYASDLSKKLSKMSHLDLSNIKVVVPKKEAPKAADKAAAAPEAIPEPDTEIALPISFTAVLQCQKRLQETLRVTLPLSEFIARATELANEELPRSKNAKPTADELFNAVLGVQAPKTSRGSFIPQITALPATPASRPVKTQKPDIFDVLAGKSTNATAKKPLSGPAGVASPINVFSLSVKKGEEKRATVFLERVKSVLEAEPGQLVL
ncbi:uncharacterized protein K452DRAFT_351003 [Aplosporella prunicola CBS 121167]|uniref:Uncharacterized protein n=1 Tax=Aplosporella prunicola CBS 121167 TaxID=1176127 RepID=A0A6A6BCP4_9PEZI|nr:uncharacterized protein K452DRAFT_351003 [Aplosporella prunicola CBS 121167]KAF2141969.1 hypothetical protein K452DRAFT_351003 [Aplosporella prunicola CBS 121167]